MKRPAFVLAVALGMTVSSWTGDAQSLERWTPAKRHAHCRYESWNGRAGFTDHEVRMLIYCAEDHFNTNIGTALDVADRESSFECKAQNSSTSAAGIYQIVASTWSSWWSAIRPRFDGWGLHNNRLLCRANVLISINAAHRWGWGAWGE